MVCMLALLGQRQKGAKLTVMVDTKWAWLCNLIPNQSEFLFLFGFILFPFYFV